MSNTWICPNCRTTASKEDYPGEEGKLFCWECLCNTGKRFCVVDLDTLEQPAPEPKKRGRRSA